MHKDKPVYAGVFLVEETRARLLEYVAPKHKNVFAHHLTLAFGKNILPSYPLGDICPIQVLGVADDEKGQAVVCGGDHVYNLCHGAQLPHITISCADGVKPVYSNELLQAQKVRIFHRPIRIWGVVDFFPRTKP